MVRGAVGALARRNREAGSLTDPSVLSVLRAGLPGFLREGFLPLAAFYAGLRISGLEAGIAASAFLSVVLYVYERAAGREGMLVRLSLAFVAVQTLVGVLSHSAVVYLATPVLANAAWGFAFLGSAAVSRPLAGALACAWYPFPREFRETAEFKRVYGVESVVWGVYLLGRGALRLAALLQGTVGNYVVVAFLTGTPTMLLLLIWSIWYAIRELSRPSNEGFAAEPQQVTAGDGI
jgi:Protein of unknown function (DUF3159)